jgi:trehalose/maltose hydrolase-like predicted phosphorylase
MAIGDRGAYTSHRQREIEDGTEAVPPGFWMEHVFHMSHIAQSAWFQYLYTDDLAYLKTAGYPVVKECARFFLANMCSEREETKLRDQTERPSYACSTDPDL